MCLDRLGNRSRNGRNCRFVKDHFSAVESFRQYVFVSDTALNEIYVAANLAEVLAMTRREIVEHSDARTAGAQC